MQPETHTAFGEKKKEINQSSSIKLPDHGNKNFQGSQGNPARSIMIAAGRLESFCRHRRGRLSIGSPGRGGE